MISVNIYFRIWFIWWRRWTFLTIMFFRLTSPFWDLNDFLQWMKMVLTSDCFWEFFFLSFLLLLHFWFFRVSGFSIFDFIRLELLPDGNSWLLLLELFSFFWHVCRINLTWIDFFYISDSISLLCCMLLSMRPINSLSANFTKWSNTLKQFVVKLPTNCLSVFDHFVGLALKELRKKRGWETKFQSHTIRLVELSNTQMQILSNKISVESLSRCLSVRLSVSSAFFSGSAH